MTDRSRDRGSVTAELALALPAVVLVLLAGLGGLAAAAQQVLLQDAVADAARLLGRGEGPAAAQAAVVRAVPGAVVGTADDGDLACVSAEADVGAGRWLRVSLHARSCALSGGR